VEYRTLGQTDQQVSSIGLGCVTFGREIDQDVALGVMDRAVEQGINLFDTAEAYAGGRSEEIIGQWLAARQSRNQIVLTTKVAGAMSRDHILASAEESLRRLNTDYIDLFKAHNWDPETPIEETLEALNTLVQQGKVRYIGASNYTTEQLAQAIQSTQTNGGARLEAIQPNYSLVVRDIEEDLLPLCAKHKIGVVSYSPLGAGFLSGKYRQGGPVPKGTRFDVIPGHQDIYFNDECFRILEGLRAKAEQVGRSMIQLAMAWAIGQPGITSVLVGARNTDQVDQAFEAEATGLSDELRAELNNL
jgi:aryl-alcohol dehydrogenase-like predicted oxidoreductase